MPGSLDSCINNVYEPGNIPASSGMPPVRVLLRDPYEVLVSEAAAALDAVDKALPIFDVAVFEAAAALDDADVALQAKSAMLPAVFVNSSGITRQANADGIMVNL